MKFVVETSSDANPAELESILEKRGLSGEVQVEIQERWVELAGDSDLAAAERVLRAAFDWIGVEAWISLRIELDEDDLLYSLAPEYLEPALAALPGDVSSFRPGRDDGFRNWFRGRWMGMDDEVGLTMDELSTVPLTADRILDLLDPPEHRDWRPVQWSLERWAKCADVVQAMSLAGPSHRGRLAYLITRRGRSCSGATPFLIQWLEDPDPQVAEEAAIALGRQLARTRSPQRLAAAQQAAGPPLLRYAQAHPGPLVLTALGVTAYLPARAYLEDVVANPADDLQRRYAVRALQNLDWYSSPQNAGKRPPFWGTSP